MAQVIITLTDVDPFDLALDLDVTFNPPINDRPSFCQEIALRLANQISDGCRFASRRQLKAICHRRPDLTKEQTPDCQGP